ncbi:MAG: SRPBCC family protein [Candidatus Obscuribacterales bacterium]|nr:SRPBCC family protein [Candidatus Obscuribacterales bacterium]
MKRIAALIAILAFTILGLPAMAKTGKTQPVSDSVVINAPKETVWQAVVSADKFDANIRQSDGKVAIVEQEFQRIPFMGSVKTTLKVTAKENEMLAYEMVDGRVKEFSGCWELIPVETNVTKLKLTSNVDPGLPIPRFLVRQFIKSKVTHRLEKTKKLAEQIHNSRQASKEQPAQ